MIGNTQVGWRLWPGCWHQPEPPPQILTPQRLSQGLQPPAQDPHQGSGQIRAKIYAKLKPFPGQSSTRKLREVFHTALRETGGVTDPARVQSVLPIEDHVVPANRADVRQQGGINLRL